jgi:hypothetical protein
MMSTNIDFSANYSALFKEMYGFLFRPEIEDSE